MVTVSGNLTPLTLLPSTVVKLKDYHKTVNRKFVLMYMFGALFSLLNESSRVTAGDAKDSNEKWTKHRLKAYTVTINREGKPVTPFHET